MKKTDYTFTFEGFSFVADFQIFENGIDLQDAWIESGIDDELIPIKDIKRLHILEKHLEQVFKDEIDILNSNTEYYRECNTSDTFRPGV
jgi:hypothetical protein